MFQTTWDEKSVRENLPDVKVKMGETILDCHVRGRLNQFASVSTKIDPSTGKGGDYIGDWSWAAVARSLNNQSPLLA